VRIKPIIGMTHEQYAARPERPLDDLQDKIWTVGAFIAIGIFVIAALVH
jgi:hypothetical protein